MQENPSISGYRSNLIQLQCLETNFSKENLFVKQEGGYFKLWCRHEKWYLNRTFIVRVLTTTTPLSTVT